jgi:hypothetical protein
MNAPVRIERLILTDPTDPRIPHHQTPLSRFVTDCAGSDLTAVVTFCAVGLLLSAALLIALPPSGDLAQSLQHIM